MTPPAEPIPGDDPATGERVAQARVTAPDVAQIVGVSVLSFEAMFDRAVNVFGWDRDAWERWEPSEAKLLIEHRG
jgi:hypothetical protein